VDRRRRLMYPIGFALVAMAAAGLPLVPLLPLTPIKGVYYSAAYIGGMTPLCKPVDACIPDPRVIAGAIGLEWIDFGASAALILIASLQLVKRVRSIELMYVAHWTLVLSGLAACALVFSTPVASNLPQAWDLSALGMGLALIGSIVALRGGSG
jgi:hypothetical protein